MRLNWLIFCFLIVPAMAQTPRQPNLDAQRAAMKELGFLIGTWSGEARLYSASGEPKVLAMTEHAECKLDGLILTIEGAGRNTADPKPALQAFGVISYDDESGTYHMRAFNDGRFLETVVKLAGDGRGLAWGFTLGQYQTHSSLRITDAGDWIEHHEISVGTAAPRTLMDLKVSREK